jgi:hypothetical protein
LKPAACRHGDSEERRSLEIASPPWRRCTRRGVGHDAHGEGRVMVDSEHFQVCLKDPQACPYHGSAGIRR